MAPLRERLDGGGTWPRGWLLGGEVASGGQALGSSRSCCSRVAPRASAARQYPSWLQCACAVLQYILRLRFLALAGSMGTWPIVPLRTGSHSYRAGSCSVWRLLLCRDDRVCQTVLFFPRTLGSRKRAHILISVCVMIYDQAWPNVTIFSTV